ncbi:hypothetical protein ACS0TY_007929 [Phlomoides rotata]
MPTSQFNSSLHIQYLVPTSLSPPQLNCFMASFQVDATPVEDVITEAESTTTVVAPPPPPPEIVIPVDEEDPEDLTAPPYDEKVGNSDNEEERDVEYSPFVEGGEEEEQPSWYALGEPATFDGNNDEDDDDF